MPKILNQLLKPFLQYYSMEWLKDKNYIPKMETNLKSYIRKASRSNVGQRLGIKPNSPIRDIPLTFYKFYQPFFEKPEQGDFIYPLDDYVRAYTSGTMGRPKTFLLPKSGLWKSLQKTGMTILFLSTHDGEKITYEVGDTVYENMPGGQFISSFYYDLIDKRIQGGWVNQVPDVNRSFQDKVNYFIEHYNEIDIAYMTVTTLLDQVYPKINAPLRLKGFMTQDRAAYILKDKIKKITGAYPKTIYGSTETMFGALPSIEYPGCFFFDWRVIYPEFLPEKHAKDNDLETSEPLDEIVLMENVEVGQVYQLIATPFGNDLVRYVMPDLLECIALEDKILKTTIPIFRYYARSDKLMVLHNFTRINEDELIDVLNNLEIDYVDFVANRELYDSRDYMKMYIELQKDQDKQELLERINESLSQYDKDWRDLSSMLQYVPLKLEILPTGSFKKYLQRKPGMPKISRINMSKENMRLLLE